MDIGCTDLTVQLAKLHKEWNATAEFLRAQGINPECPSMPQFENLLSAARNEKEVVVAEVEEDDEDEE